MDGTNILGRREFLAGASIHQGSGAIQDGKKDRTVGR